MRLKLIVPVISFPVRNKLAYPSGVVPGINMTHPAAANLRFSGVASGGNNFVNLMTGAKGVLTSTPTFSLHGTLGPTLNSAVDSNQSAAFSGMSTANDALLTFAVMINYNSISASDQNLFTATSNFGAGGCFLKLNATTGVLAGAMNGAGGFDATPLAVPGGNVPLFILVSLNFVSAAGNWMFRRLDTGQIQFISKALAAGSTAGNGTCVVGDIVTNGFTGTNGGIAAAMYSAQFMTIPQMLSFADNPWAFWYPPQARSLIATDAAAATQYAAFSTPQHSLSQVINRMIGY